MTIGTQNNKSHAVKLKPPGVGAPNGFRYIPEGYHVCKNIVSSPGAACKRYFRWLLFLYPKKEDDAMKSNAGHGGGAEQNKNRAYPDDLPPGRRKLCGHEAERALPQNNKGIF